MGAGPAETTKERDMPTSEGPDLVCDDAASMRAALEDPSLTAMYLSGMCTRDPRSIRHHRDLVEDVLAEGGRPPAGALMVLARCAELEGRAEEHQKLVELALDLDPTLPCGLAELSWALADRGRARAALVAFDLSGAIGFDRHRLSMLHVLATTGPVRARRNERCPCGTGQRFKRCCAMSGGWPLQTRAVWLIDKAMTFAGRPAQRDAVIDLVHEAVTDELPPHLVDRVAASRPARMVALFEAGLLERFRDERSCLLPADEAALLESWIGSHQRLLRCVSRHEDKGGEMLDLTSGELLHVSYVSDEGGPLGVFVAAPLADADGRLALFDAALPPEPLVEELLADWTVHGPKALVAMEARLLLRSAATFGDDDG
jgi:hypothetical protein